MDLILLFQSRCCKIWYSDYIIDMIDYSDYTIVSLLRPPNGRMYAYCSCNNINNEISIMHLQNSIHSLQISYSTRFIMCRMTNVYEDLIQYISIL